MQISVEGLTAGIINGLAAKGYAVEIDADSGYANVYKQDKETKDATVPSEAVS